MSYDFDDEPTNVLPPKRRGLQRLGGWWFRFLMRCALDARWALLNRWGMRRLFGRQP